MKKIIILLITIFSILNANTVSAKMTSLACPNEKLYKEFISAFVADRNSAIDIYVPRGCTIIFKGTPLSIVEMKWSRVKVIFFDEFKKRKVIMYTAIEAVR